MGRTIREKFVGGTNRLNTSLMKGTPLLTPAVILLNLLVLVGAIISTVYYERDRNTVALVFMVILWTMYAYQLLTGIGINMIFLIFNQFGQK